MTRMGTGFEADAMRAEYDKSISQKKNVFPLHIRSTAPETTGYVLQPIMIIVILKLGIIMEEMKINKKNKQHHFQKEKNHDKYQTRDAINMKAKKMLFLCLW